jgi:hypothetical protein
MPSSRLRCDEDGERQVLDHYSVEHDHGGNSEHDPEYGRNGNKDTAYSSCNNNDNDATNGNQKHSEAPNQPTTTTTKATTETKIPTFNSKHTVHVFIHKLHASASQQT